MYNCGCNSNKTQETRGEVTNSPIHVEKEYIDIPSIDIDTNCEDDQMGKVGHDGCLCPPSPHPDCHRKDPYEPIIVTPGNDILLGIKLRTTDDKQVIDIDASTIKDLRVYVGEKSISFYVDPIIRCLLHTKVESEVISELGKYDIVINGVWNNNNISFTFHDKIIVTNRKQCDPAKSIRHNVASPEEYAGSAIFIPAPHTYRTEEELRDIIAYYQEMIIALEETKKDIEDEKNKLVYITNEVFPAIRNDVSILIEKAAREDTLKKESEEIKELIAKEGADYARNAFSKMKRVDEYLYSIEYDEINWEKARKYFEDHIIEPIVGGCTGLRKGNEVGRNYDWNYDKSIEFILRTKAHNGRYASIGIAGNVSKFTPETISKYDEYYNYLPFRMLDGINEKGVACNINMLNPDEKRSLPVEGTVPEVEEREKICSFMLCRYILDGFDSAKKAAEYLRDYVKVYPAVIGGKGFDLHLAIYDKDDTYYVTFEPDEAGVFRVIIEKVSDSDFVMTNFRLRWANENMTEDGFYDRFSQKMHGEQLCIEKYGEGIERANLCLDFIRDEETTKSVIDFICDDIKYTNAYNKDLPVQWYTEFVGDYRNSEVVKKLDLSRWATEEEYSQDTDVPSVMTLVRGFFEHRDRNIPNTWQTVHSCVYDLENKILQIITQEQDTVTNIGTEETPILVNNVLTIDCFKKENDDYAKQETLLETKRELSDVHALIGSFEDGDNEDVLTKLRKIQKDKITPMTDDEIEKAWKGELVESNKYL